MTVVRTTTTLRDELARLRDGANATAMRCNELRDVQSAAWYTSRALAFDAAISLVDAGIK